MNSPYLKPLTTAVRWLILVLALFLFLPGGHAQTNTGGGRWLLIFDTSSLMKKRLPATEAALKQFFSTRADGQLETGDSMAVWTFNQKIDALFTPFNWSTNLTSSITTNLIDYLRMQRYTGDSSLAVVQSPLERVVARSPRLTIILFSDCQSEIKGTPYDAGINQAFRDDQAERKKSQQPLVVVLRTQFGKFIGCTLNYPPEKLAFPSFPPPPPPPVVVPPHPVTVIPPVAVPALVIVGTQVGTNPDVPMKVTAPVIPASNPIPNVMPVATSPVIPVATPVIIVTNPVNQATPLPPTNPVAAPPTENKVPPPNPAPTNLAAPTAASGPDQPTWVLIYIGIALLVVAVVLVVLLVVRIGQRPQASLITSSMQDVPPRK